MDRIFSDHLVTFDDFRRNPASLLANPNLGFFVNGKISAYNAEMQALTEDTESIRSELDDHKRLKPNHEELLAMDLHSGMNELVFVLNSQDPVEEVARVTATLYVWPVHAKVLIAHMDGAIISCATTGRIFKGEVRMKCIQANVLRTRFRSNVRDKREASLPMGPVLHSPDRLLSTASLDDSQDVNMAALDDFRSLFPRCLNPFYASFSTTHAASLVFTKWVCFPGKYPNDGRLRHQSIGGFRESYKSLLDRMDSMFPPIYSLTCTEHEAVRSFCSTTSRASLEDEHFVSEPVRLIGWSQDCR
ncbi:hypothetical protein PsorP6_018888 [Peronosclerospora sorghi]|nr:hypothetical protein PsorP6_018908 [Peronosclerospora sorghi]KAI9895560.1 hypothetical protein PsorP6_018888 [Peronosclerospora sorghi]